METARGGRTDFSAATARSCLHAVSREEMAELVGSQVHKWHFMELFLGMALAFLLTGVALWSAWNWFTMQLEKARRKNADIVLEKLSGAELKRVCGNVNLPAWVRYPDFERVQWMNDLIDQLWPNVKATAAGMVREQLTPMLLANKPSWIYDIAVSNFTLGDNPPKISAVKVFNTESVVDEIGLEMECIWNGSQQFQLAIRPFPRLPVGLGVGAALSKMLAMKVGVGSIWFKGKARIALKPLLDHLPLVGAVKVSLVEAPDFTFSIQVQGGDITFLPGLETWITAFIKDSLLQPYVLPEGFTVPLDPQLGSVDVPKGLLYIKILGAQSLPWLDWLTLPDPYVVVYVRGRRKHRTKVCRRSFNPRWGEEYALLVHDPEHQALTAVVHDQDYFGADKEVGRITVPIQDLPESGETEEDWFDLQPPSGTRPQNALQMGLAGVQTVSNVVRNTVHLPFSLGRNKEPPRLHLQLTYYRIGEAEVRAATHAHDLGQATGPPQNPELVKMLRGGVLVVTVKKGIDDGSLHGGTACDLVTINVAGQTRGTAGVYGEKDPSWEEVLELAVPGDVLEGVDEQIEVRVWDCHWLDNTTENLTWEMGLWRREGILNIPLSRVVEERHLDDTFQLENVDGEIDLELRWIPMLEPNSAAAADA